MIVVTTGMVGDLVEHIVGEHAEVTALMGQGADPHLYRPTNNDIGKMMLADVIFYNGLHLEGALQSAFEHAEANGKVVSAVAESVPKRFLLYPEDFEEHPDPHVWNHPGLWQYCIDEVVRVLSRLDPEHAGEFEKNGEGYRAQLVEMEQYVREVTATIPEEQRHLVTAHDAFGYFAAASQLTVHSVQGITTESDPGVQDINHLVDFLVTTKVPAIFVEATINPANIRAVVEGAKSRGWSVKIGGTLYSDSMGAAGTYEGTYLGMIDHNATLITHALGGTAPERGKNGQLEMVQD